MRESATSHLPNVGAGPGKGLNIILWCVQPAGARARAIEMTKISVIGRVRKNRFSEKPGQWIVDD